MDQIIAYVLPDRSIFNANFWSLSIYACAVLGIAFWVGKKWQASHILLGTILLIALGLGLQIDSLYYYTFVLYSFTLCFIGYSLGAIFNKRTKYSIVKLTNHSASPHIPITNSKLLGIRNVVLPIIVSGALCLLFAIQIQGNFNLVVSADSWQHIASVQKIGESIGASFSPLLQGELNHYPPFSYLVVKLSGMLLGITDMVYVYGIAGIRLMFCTYLLYYLYTYTLFKNHWISLAALGVFFSFSQQFLPNFFYLFLQMTFLLLLYRLYVERSTKSYLHHLLMIQLIVAIGYTHYYGLAETLLISCLYGAFLWIFTKAYVKRWLHKIILTARSIDLTQFSIRPQYILLLFAISIPVFQKVGHAFFAYSYSEVGLDPSKVAYFLVVGYAIISLLTMFGMRDTTPKRIAFFLTIATLYTNIIFYYTGIFQFHIRYFPEKSILFFFLPFGLYHIYNSIITYRYRVLHLIVSLLLLFTSSSRISYHYFQKYIPGSNSYRVNLTSELLPYASMFKNKTLFIDPYSFLNRYAVVDFQAFVYAVNYKDTTKGRPFTTVPDKIESYEFAKFPDRLAKALRFMTGANASTYSDISSYPIDYFVIEKDNPTHSGMQSFFEKHHFPLIAETQQYLIYQQK